MFFKLNNFITKHIKLLIINLQKIFLFYDNNNNFIIFIYHKKNINIHVGVSLILVFSVVFNNYNNIIIKHHINKYNN